MVIRSFAKPEEELKGLKLQLVKLGLIDCIATVAMGLGLYSLFVDSPGSLFPVLGKPGVGIALLVCGAIIALFAMPKGIKLTQEIRKVEQTIAGAD